MRYAAFFITFSLVAIAPATAQAGGAFSVVNGTGGPIQSISIKPSGGEWQSLGGASSPGARVTLTAPKSEICAYDLRAQLAGGGEAVWPNVNLCETKSVTLNRRPDGTTWVDYD